MVRQLAIRRTATLILTSYLVEEERTLALAAGARRYLLKDIDGAALIAEIEAACDPAAPTTAGT
jgi:DNA-binding NarL/FixJ family response regulator